jgi:hypothetical protein
MTKLKNDQQQKAHTGNWWMSKVLMSNEYSSRLVPVPCDANEPTKQFNRKWRLVIQCQIHAQAEWGENQVNARSYTHFIVQMIVAIGVFVPFPWIAAMTETTLSCYPNPKVWHRRWVTSGGDRLFLVDRIFGVLIFIPVREVIFTYLQVRKFWIANALFCVGNSNHGNSEWLLVCVWFRWLHWCLNYVTGQFSTVANTSKNRYSGGTGAHRQHIFARDLILRRSFDT